MGVLPDVQHQGFLRVWRRHAQRRRDGAPSVSVAIITSEAERDELEAVLEEAGSMLVHAGASDASAMASEWLTGIAEQIDVLDEAFGFVAAELDEREQELRASWSACSDLERKRWLAQSADDALPPLRAALECLLRAIELGDDTHRDKLLELRELLIWLPQRERLVLCLEASGPAALRSLLRLADVAPEWPLLVLVPFTIWGSMREQLDDRSQTLLDAGLLPLPGPVLITPATLEIAPAPVFKPARLGRSLRPAAPQPEQAHLEMVAADAVRTARVARESGAPDAGALTERARSLAEARLFELLQAEPVTRDLFALNLRLPFTFGPARAEVDLACTELRIAVEVDGYYHFHGSDAYRRDRRKDVLLQHQGYLVSRHLATDVIERAGEVVQAIRELVLRRRRSFRKENAT